MYASHDHRSTFWMSVLESEAMDFPFLDQAARTQRLWIGLVTEEKEIASLLRLFLNGRPGNDVTLTLPAPGHKRQANDLSFFFPFLGLARNQMNEVKLSSPKKMEEKKGERKRV
jgi:hypothetical protein